MESSFGMAVYWKGRNHVFSHAFEVGITNAQRYIDEVLESHARLCWGAVTDFCNTRL